MPRYFFHVVDGESLPDHDGTELPDMDAARGEAARLAGRLLQDHPGDFWASGEWRIVVTDVEGSELFSLAFHAIEPSPRPESGQ